MSRHFRSSLLGVALVFSFGLPSPGASQAHYATLGEPIFVFGEGEGNPSELLGRVSAVAGLEQGLWAIGDALSHTIHIVDDSGALVTSLGGPGDGPGEFRTIAQRGLWALPDGGLGAWDPRAGRVTYFTGERFEEIETISVQQDGGIGRPDMFIGALREGLLIASTVGGALSGGNPGPSPDHHEVGLFTLDGRFIRKVAELEGFVRARSGVPPMVTIGPIAFSPIAMVARGSDQVAFTNGEHREIEVLNAAGAIRSIRVEAGATITRNQAWRELDELARDEDAVSGFWATSISTQDRSIGPVPTLGAVVGGASHLWVQAYEVSRHAMPFRSGTRGGGGGNWTVYDWSGGLVGTVRVPDDFVLMTVSDRWVAGIRTDPTGVESFTVFYNPVDRD